MPQLGVGWKAFTGIKHLADPEAAYADFSDETLGASKAGKAMAMRVGVGDLAIASFSAAAALACPRKETRRNLHAAMAVSNLLSVGLDLQSARDSGLKQNEANLRAVAGALLGCLAAATAYKEHSELPY